LLALGWMKSFTHRTSFFNEISRLSDRDLLVN